MNEKQRRRANSMVRVLWGLALLGCATENPGVPPPPDQLLFPAGLALSPDGTILYVVNANSDLRYNTGTLIALDLDRAGSEACPCAEDPTDPHVDTCEEACLVRDSVRIGSFGTSVRVREDGRRLYLAERSTPSVVWADVDPSQAESLDCGQQREGANACAGRNLVTGVVRGEDTVFLSAEPFDVELLEVDGLAPRLLVTHLSAGSVTVLDDCGDEVRALDTSDALFPRDRQGRGGAFDVAPLPSALAQGPLFYATSRVSTLVATFVIDPAPERCEASTRVVPGPTFTLRALYDGSDARGIAFAPDGTRAFIADREPPTLVEVDTTLEDGVPRNRVLRSVEVCPEPSIVRLDSASSRPLVYVVCFATAQIFVVDAQAMEVVSVIVTGRGPNALEFDPARMRAYIANFAENTVGVIDLDANSPTYRFMVRRLGRPEPLR